MDSIIILDLADDSADIRGFGQPVTPRFAALMVDDFCNGCDTAWDFLNSVTSNHPGYKFLQKMLDPKKHVVSGVFGKEIIQQLLSQTDCEGIRYSFGTFEDKATVILQVVKQVSVSNGIAASTPLTPVGEDDFFLRLTSAPQSLASDPMMVEVHKGSLTREMGTLKVEKIADEPLFYNKAVFGTY